MGIVATVAVHAALLTAILIKPSLVDIAVPDAPLSVDILTERPEPEPEPLPRPPELKSPPRPVITLPQLPQIETPTNAITLPVQTAPPPPAPSAKAVDNYYARLSAHFSRFKRYPPGTRDNGIVKIRFAVARSGTVLSFSIAQSSGMPALDEAAYALIQRAQPLPPIPPEILQDRLDLVIPIEFLYARR